MYPYNNIRVLDPDRLVSVRSGPTLQGVSVGGRDEPRLDQERVVRWRPIVDSTGSQTDGSSTTGLSVRTGSTIMRGGSGHLTGLFTPTTSMSRFLGSHFPRRFLDRGIPGLVDGHWSRERETKDWFRVIFLYLYWPGHTLIYLTKFINDRKGWPERVSLYGTITVRRTGSLQCLLVNWTPPVTLHSLPLSTFRNSRTCTRTVTTIGRLHSGRVGSAADKKAVSTVSCPCRLGVTYITLTLYLETTPFGDSKNLNRQWRLTP